MTWVILLSVLAVPILRVYVLRVLNDQPSQEVPNAVTPCETLTVGEAAAKLGISPSGAYRQINETGKLGPLTPIRIGRRIMFGRRQVETLLAGGEVTA